MYIRTVVRFIVSHKIPYDWNRKHFRKIAHSTLANICILHTHCSIDLLAVYVNTRICENWDVHSKKNFNSNQLEFLSRLNHAVAISQRLTWLRQISTIHEQFGIAMHLCLIFDDRKKSFFFILWIKDWCRFVDCKRELNRSE